MTFTVKLVDLLAANHPGCITTVEIRDRALVEHYAAMPAATAPPVRVKRNLRIADGWHRVAAAKKRGDVDVLCTAATTHEELSA